MKKLEENRIIASDQIKKVSQLESAIKSGQFLKIEKSPREEK